MRKNSKNMEKVIKKEKEKALKVAQKIGTAREKKGIRSKIWLTS